MDWLGVAGGMPQAEAAPTVCSMCSSECGLLAQEMADGTVSIKGNPAHPMNAGGTCPKAFLSDELRCSYDRLTSPLKRVGRRGEGRFVPVSWETALDEIARRLTAIRRSSGPEALTILFGEKPDHDMVYEFAQLFGTPNILDHNSLCDTSRRLGFSLTYGRGHERPLPDLQRPLFTENGVRRAHDCRLLVLFGENPADARRFYWLWDGIRQARREGMTLIVVDPYKSRTAEAADAWLPITPGEDAALILSILRYVIENDGTRGGYLDQDFISAHTSGWEELKAQLLSADRDPATGHPLYSIAWASARTGLPSGAIVDLAHMMGTTKPACGMVGMNGVSHHVNGFMATRALAILLAITGNLDVPGGLHLRRQPAVASPREAMTAALGKQAHKHKDRFGAFPLASHGVVARIPEDILNGIRLESGPFSGHSYSTRALMVIHGNPALTAPESPKWIDAFTAVDDTGAYKLELFVFNDIFLNDTGLYADFVLPMTHFLERQGVVVNETLNPVVSLRVPVIAPPKGCRTPLAIYRDLAARVSAGGPRAAMLAAASDDDWCDVMLSPLLPPRDGLSPTQLLRREGGVHALPTAYRKHEATGFDTPSGKVELVSRDLHDLGLDCPAGLDCEPLPRPNVAGKTFHLITGRSYFHTHSMTQNLDVPSRFRQPALLMNREDADESGLANGDRVVVRNASGQQIRATIEVTGRLRPGVVRGQHGWGAVSPFLSNKAEGTYNINRLTRCSRIHPVSGNSCFGDTIVAIEKARGETAHE